MSTRENGRTMLALAAAVVAVGVGVLTARTVLAQTSDGSRFDVFDPDKTLGMESTSTSSSLSSAQETTEPPPTGSGPPGRPPVRDPFRPPTRTPFRP